MRTLIIKESPMKSKTSNFIAVVVMIVGIAHIVDAQEVTLSIGEAIGKAVSAVLE